MGSFLSSEDTPPRPAKRHMLYVVSVYVYRLGQRKRGKAKSLDFPILLYASSNSNI
jgi:hypothetical protein